MGMSFSGVGSGLPVSDWIDAIMATERKPIDTLYTRKSALQTSKTTFSTVESKFTSLRSAIEKLTDSKLSSSFDVFGKRKASSSDEKIATATANNQAIPQKVKLKVEQLASSTKAQSYFNNVGETANSNTTIESLGNRAGTTGTFSIYVKGVKQEFKIESGDTLGNIASDITNAGIGLTASIDEATGKFSITGENLTANDIKFGSNNDTSNFLNITQLATATGVETGTAPNTTTTFSSINSLNSINSTGTLVGGKEGTFTLKINDVEHQINIDANSTLSSVAQAITDLGVGVTGSVENNKIKISFDKTVVTSFTMGSDSDTSNFLKVAGLDNTSSTTTDNLTTYSGSKEISGKVTEGTANTKINVTAGNFTIGKATFTINEDTTLNDLIAKINSSEDAGVIASFDVLSNKMVLSSKNPGNTAINLKDGDDDTETSDSNFLSAMGLVNSTTKDSISSQTLGKNAKVYINDSSVALEAKSNTLTSDITGISGLTVNLIKISEGETIDIDVNQDTDQLKDAVKNFLTKFNDVINEIDTDTKSGGKLSSEYTLVRLRNDLRMTATNSVTGQTDFDSLAMIGITSGSVGTSKDANTKNLNLDEAKFIEALTKNPSEVKALLIGDKSKGVTGILETLETKVENALDPTNGYFNTREDSMTRMISDLDKSIERGEERLTTRKETLVKQFSMMDQMISQMKSQSSSLSML